MKSYKFVAAAVLSLGLLGLTMGADEKPKFTIKEVMKEAHKGGLLKKVAGGKADKEEKEKLIALYVALNQNEPPKGDKEEWKKKTEEIVAAAKTVAKDDTDKDAVKKLTTVTNCGACHGKFKGN
jgi:hypothetical protein